MHSDMAKDAEGSRWMVCIRTAASTLEWHQT